MRSNTNYFKQRFAALGALLSAMAMSACVAGTTDPTVGSSNEVGGGAPTSGTRGTDTEGGSPSGSAGTSAGSAGTSSTTPTGEVALPITAPYARLTRAEYRATIYSAFGLDPSVTGVPDDNRVGNFTSNAQDPQDQVGAFMLAGEDLSALIVPTKVPACTAANAVTCIPANFQVPIEKLYRRSLTADEIASFSTMLSALEKAGVASRDATRQVLSTVLMSPDFLFRATPVGGDAARAEQLSEQLSYALWDAPPDAELTTAAKATGTTLDATLRTQALRLAKDARAIAPLSRFMAQWLNVDVDINLGDPTYAASPLYLELLAYVQDAVTNNVPVTSFVNGTRGFVQKDNATAYGLNVPSTTANVAQVTWPTTSARRGMVGQELVIDATRNPDVTRRPIFRGKLVQSSLLCNAIPPPPPELQALQGEVTDRTTDPRCKACHLMMEPIGAAFASMDLDQTGTTPPAVLTGNPEVAGTYPDLPALLNKIANSQAFADCFSRNLMGFFLEQDPAQMDPAAVVDISSLVKSGAGFADVVAQTIVSLETRSKSTTPWCAAP